MNQEEREFLAKCNCLVGDNRMPAEKRGDDFFTPTGLKIWPPTKWQMATYDEIVQNMDERGYVPVKEPYNGGMIAGMLKKAETPNA